MRSLLVASLLCPALAWADCVVYYQSSDNAILGSVCGIASTTSARPQDFGPGTGAVWFKSLPALTRGQQWVLNTDRSIGVQADPLYAQQQQIKQDAILKMKTATGLTDLQLKALGLN